MNKILVLFLFLCTLTFGANQCIVCHKNVEDIRDKESLMMKEIFKIADKAGHKNNDCIVCHGGNPKSNSIKYAHRGTVKYFKTNKGPKKYYKNPANPWINANTCGICHPNQVGAQINSLMMSQQGKIQNALFSLKVKDDNRHDIANYSSKNPDDIQKRVGSDVYKKYMQKLSFMEPQAFVSQVYELPGAPTAKEIQKNPSLAVYTYLRGDKNTHKEKGCSSCHIPYLGEKGHLLTHKIQSSRKVKIQTADVNYSGIPVSTCAVCHSDGKNIATSYQGDIELEMGSKNYFHIQEDIHFKKGMLCQDCHTSNDLHGDGFLGGASAGAVEIECQDCHGTTNKYPWELPIGYSDEFNTTQISAQERGVSKDLAKYLKQGFVADVEDGYILSARGNPLPKAVKKDNKIIIYLANGKDIELKPLKLLKETKKLSKEALLSMDAIAAHDTRLECYSCHSTWAPQSYGHKIKIDYSKGKKSIDYLAASHDKNSNFKKHLINGEVTQSRVYLRWEEPTLSQNAEGRISPAIPAYQTSLTVIGKNKKTLLKKDIFSANMTPLQPHTMAKRARTCESCHINPKILGLGIEVDLQNSTKSIDVGTHFKLSAPLSKVQIDKLDRRGACISCHVDMPDGNLAISVMSHIAQVAEYKVDKKEHGVILNTLLNIGAWVQIVIGFIIATLILYGIYIGFLKKEPNNPRNEGWK
jgi:hypothetical protein